MPVLLVFHSVLPSIGSSNHGGVENMSHDDLFLLNKFNYMPYQDKKIKKLNPWKL